MGILDDLIKDIDGEEDPKKKDLEIEKDPDPKKDPEQGNENGAPSDWYSDEFRKYAGINSLE